MAAKRHWIDMDDTAAQNQGLRPSNSIPPALRDRPSNSSTPLLPMFETFRAELDEHHDRRERIIKASRDITAASKKIIFTLQRIREVGKPIPDNIKASYTDYLTTIRERFTTVAPDLQGTNAYRYERNISGGCQEYIEALSFEHYLTTGKLISYTEAAHNIKSLDAGDGLGVQLTPEDYILGIYDMTGELMRFAITTMAIHGTLLVIGKVQEGTQGTRGQRSVLTDMRDLRMALEGIDAKTGPFARDVEKKAEVMRTSVEKVEKAIYGVVVRGAERPTGWLPELSDAGAGRTAEVESYA